MVEALTSRWFRKVALMIGVLVGPALQRAPAQDGDCWCTLLIRLNGGVWEKQCSPSQCLDSEGWCEEAMMAGRFYCRCSASQNPNGFPTSCICTGAASQTAVP